MIQEALGLRRKYMRSSGQTFPNFLDKYLPSEHDESQKDKQQKIGEINYGMVTQSMRDEFLCDHFRIMKLMGDKELYNLDFNLFLYYFINIFNSFFQRDEYCRRRLKYLRLKFDMHMLMNERAELEEQKRIAGVDFSRVHKVDNHIHAACSMTQSHLLEFIKRKLDESGSLIVVKNYNKTNRPATLAQVFDDLGLKRDEINLDSLGIRATSELFCRFDRFNARFSPFEKPSLRDLFLKVENDLDGQFYAELIGVSFILIT